MVNEFPFEVGQIVKKAEVHALVSGSGQHAMTSCLGKSAFLLFHNKERGKENCYDKWEGEQADGTFDYTGQGLVGDQKMTVQNLNLVKMAQEGKPIHFFYTDSKKKTTPPYEYRGLVTLGNPMYEWKEALDTKGNLRKVIVYHLVPIGHGKFKSETIPDEQNSLGYQVCEWSPPPTAAFPSGGIVNLPTQIDLEENKLQKRFGDFLVNQGEIVKTIPISLPNAKGTLKPDFFLPSKNWVVEAKPSNSREHVRLAIGQALDYAHLLNMAGKLCEPGILLPGEPSSDLVSLIKELQIHLIVERELNFFETIF